MSGEHFNSGEMPHQPQRFLSDELMGLVEKNVVYGCTDVALRNAATGEIFLGQRQTEPQLGPWFIGGRNRYAVSIQGNAAMQVKNDLRLELRETRFQHISTYSTPFPVASPGRVEHGRHTLNAVMSVDLEPEEVAELDHKVETGDIRSEYSTGAWYKPAEITAPHSDFPYAVKQFVRDLYGHDVMIEALHGEALRENELHDQSSREKLQLGDEDSFQIIELTRLGFSRDEALELEDLAGSNAKWAAEWAGVACQEFTPDDAHKHGQAFGYEPAQIEPEAFRELTEKLAANEAMGDHQIMQTLREHGVARPYVVSDNGPALRDMLRGAALTLSYDEQRQGALLPELEAKSKPGEYYAFWFGRS